MSLVGSLEDLGLGEMLQIAGLSRKSGVLLLRSQAGEGRIAIRDGLVCGASMPGRPGDLASLLVGGGHLSEDQLQRALEPWRELGVPVDEALAESCGLSAERVEEILRRHVEEAVLAMFGWRCGEFVFEVGARAGDPEKEPLLRQGVSAQYYALEASRREDEREAGSARAEEPDAAGPGPGTADEEPWAAPAGAAPLVGSQAGSAGRSTPGGVTARGPAPASAPQPEAIASAPLVAIDPDLVALEWLKAALDGLFSRVHIFQRWENGAARIRQYLGRGELPVVLLSAGLAGEREGAAPGGASFLSHLRALAPRLPILVIEEQLAGRAPGRFEAADAVLRRPPASRLAGRRWSGLEAAVQSLREEIRPWVGAGPRADAGAATARGPVPAAAPAARPAPDLARVKEMSDRLREPSARGDVLSHVIAFAAESLPRVALFMVRDDMAVGLAQVELACAGGPGDQGLSEVRLPLADVPCLREAVESRRPVRAAPCEQDRALTDALGSPTPLEVYVAPIESGGRVVALVYGDALPDQAALGDTTGLEVILHQAGLVLDRALLERALARG